MLHDYDPLTLRGQIAQCVIARASEIISDVSDGAAKTVPAVSDAAKVLEENARMYDVLLEQLDMYLDDWANTLVEQLGFSRG